MLVSNQGSDITADPDNKLTFHIAHWIRFPWMALNLAPEIATQIVRLTASLEDSNCSAL